MGATFSQADLNSDNHIDKEEAIYILQMLSEMKYDLDKVGSLCLFKWGIVCGIHSKGTKKGLRITPQPLDFIYGGPTES